MHKKRLYALPLIILVMAIVQGCTLPHPTDPYTGLGEQNTNPTSEQVASPLPKTLPRDPGNPLTLDVAIDTALENNPELIASAHDRAATDARYEAAKGARLPSLSVTGGYYRYLDEQRLIPARYNGESGVFSRDTFSSDIILSLPLFTGGKLVNEIQAADLLRQASTHKLARTRNELVFNVSSVFYGILAQHRVIESLDFSKGALEKHLERINHLIVAQKAAKVDRLRTEVRIAELQQRLVRERNVLTLQMQLLSNLLGLKKTTDPLQLDSTPEKEQLPLETTLQTEDACKLVLEARPDYISAKYEVEAQAKRVDAARGSLWPKVSLQAAYGGRLAENVTDNANNLDTSDDAGKIGIGFDVPLFDGGQIQARILEEREKLAAAQSRLHKLELQIRLDVTTALSNVTSAHERVATIKKAIEQARESFRIEQQKYDLSKGTIIDVLDAQSALLDTETTYSQAQADLNIAMAQLKLATGEKK
jgi:outer membrane protein